MKRKLRDRESCRGPCTTYDLLVINLITHLLEGSSYMFSKVSVKKSPKIQVIKSFIVTESFSLQHFYVQ